MMLDMVIHTSNINVQQTKLAPPLICGQCIAFQYYYCSHEGDHISILRWMSKHNYNCFKNKLWRPLNYRISVFIAVFDKIGRTVFTYNFIIIHSNEMGIYFIIKFIIGCNVNAFSSHSILHYTIRNSTRNLHK